MSDPPTPDPHAEALAALQRFIEHLDEKYGPSTYDEDRAAILRQLAINNTDTQENRS